MLQCDRDHDAQILKHHGHARFLYSGARQEHLGQAHIQEKGAIPRWSISTIGRSFAIFISRLPQLPDRHPSASRSENGISGRRSRTSVSVMRYHGRRRIAGRSFRKEPMFPASGASRGSKPASTCGPPRYARNRCHCRRCARPAAIPRKPTSPNASPGSWACR